jgi:hypothetical protein
VRQAFDGPPMSRDRRWLAQSSTLTSLFFENALKSIKSRGENPKKVEKAANAVDLGARGAVLPPDPDRRFSVAREYRLDGEYL